MPNQKRARENGHGLGHSAGFRLLTGNLTAQLTREGPASAERLGELLVWAVRYATEQEKLVKSLRQLALTDELTGVYSRRGFLAFSAQQLKLARRLDRKVLLVFCDVDNLKLINDSYGHREGDIALQRVATALKKTFRDSDVIGRLGGDEFAMLGLTGAEWNEARLTERLNESLARASAREVRYTLAVSVGTARADSDRISSIDDLLSRADTALYAQKRIRHARLVSA